MFDIGLDDIKDGHSTFSNTFTSDDIKAILRDIKIKILTNEVEFKVDEEVLKELPQLAVVRNKFPDAIISGSICLKIFGLIQREAKDFDLIVNEKPQTFIFKNKYSGEQFFGDTRLGEAKITASTQKNLGILAFFKNILSPDKAYTVDFFLNSDAKFIEYEFEGFTYKLHDPLQIFEKKCEMIQSPDALNPNSYLGRGSDKHLLDVARIAHTLKSL